MDDKDYKELLDTLPSEPGVYKFRDREGKLIYVGKAKNIKKRVSSYFNREHEVNKTTVMVKTAVSLEFTIVDSEQDALLLENNLIKAFLPRYNVLLKDGKTYPFICIKKENFPRVFYTRKLIKDGSEYFGPYTSMGRVHVLLETIKMLFQLRTCSLSLVPKNIEKKKFKVCLEYHIGNCKGPCEALQTEDDYNQTIQQIRNLLKGHLKPVNDFLTDEMQVLSENYEFEKANLIKQKLDLLKDYQSNSTVVNADINNVDVFAFVEDETTAFVNYMKVVNGSVIQTKTIELHKKIEEEKEDLLQLAITELREQFASESNEIIVPFLIPTPSEKIKITVPQIGDKKKIIRAGRKKCFLLQIELSFKCSGKNFSIRKNIKTIKRRLQVKRYSFSY